MVNNIIKRRKKYSKHYIYHSWKCFLRLRHHRDSFADSSNYTFYITGGLFLSSWFREIIFLVNKS